jgi:signal peptidase II
VTAGRILFVIVAMAVFFLDRITKSIVATQIAYGSEVPVVGRLVGITNVRNSGAAFGFAPAGASIFLLASIAVAIGLVVYIVRNPGSPWNDAVLGLIMGGTLGNGYDRVVYGTVTDFINLHFFPVFNVADSAISVGVVLLIASSLIRKPAS